MRRPAEPPGAVRGWAWVLVAILWSGGCGGESFVPPPPPELDSLTAPDAAPTLAVEMVLGAEPTTELSAWEQAARVEAGKAKVVFTLTRLAAGEPPARQAELIRAAAARGVSALMVDPADAPEVAAALNDVRAGGTPVVLLGRPVPSRDPAKPLALVTYVPSDGPARRLVGLAVAEARGNGMGPDGHALVLRNTKAGRDAGEVADALAGALRAAGVAEVSSLPFDGDSDRAKAELIERLRADPKLAVVMASEATGLTAALNTHDELKASREFSLAGSTSFDRGSLIAQATCAGLLNRNTSLFGRQAFLHTLKLARGEPTPPAVEVETPLQPRIANVGGGFRQPGTTAPLKENRTTP